MRTRVRSSWLAVAAAFFVASTVAACGSDDDEPSSAGAGRPAVTMGAKNFTEQYILGELYAQALRAEGYTVTLKSNIGSSEIVDKALTSGELDLYPEYTGVIVATLARRDERPKSEQETYDEAQRFESARGFTLLERTPFFDADGLAVKPAYAKEHGLTTVADLKKVKRFSYGGPPENRTRFQGAVGMKQVYGLENFTFKPLSIGLQYKALASGKIDVAAIFTTDAQLQGGRYTVLKDPEGIFGFQNVAPVVSKKTLAEQGPGFADTLNAVSATLTNEAMQKMNAAVDLDKRKPAAVAKAFLEANDLV